MGENDGLQADEKIEHTFGVMIDYSKPQSYQEPITKGRGGRNQVRPLAEDKYIALCYWARDLPSTVPVSSQVYKWVSTGKFDAGGSFAMD